MYFLENIHHCRCQRAEEDGHGSKVVRGTRWSKYMKIVLVKKYIKIRFFLTKGSTYPPGGGGGVLRIYGFKASVPTFFMDLSPMTWW